MKPKIGTIVLSIALVVALAAAATFYLGRNAEMAKRIWTEDQLDRITSAKEGLEKERDELVSAKEAMETQLGDLTEQAKTLAEQMAQEKRARETLTTELASARKRATDLKKQTEAERREKATVTAELSKAKQSYQALSNELTTLRQAKEALERRVKEMLAARAKSANQIVVRPTPEAAPEQLEGRILVVNKEFNFVVLNLGSKDKLQAGDRFVVYRDGDRVGSVEVNRIYENMAAADVLEEETRDPIREGDTVRITS